MKEKKLYTCEVCNTDYKNRLDAEKCEEIHKGKFKIVEKRFLSYKQDQSGFPVAVVLQNEKGEKKIYKR